MTSFIKQLYILAISSILLSSCDSFVDIDLPKSQIVGSLVFSEPSTVNSALAGLYAELRDRDAGMLHGGTTGMTMLAAYYADELHYLGSVSSTRYGLNFYNNQLFADSDDINRIWTVAYQQIYLANRILEGVEQSTNLPAQLKDQVKGEALFVRSMLHLYLANLFGDVPYVTSTNYTLNKQIEKTAPSVIYQHLIDDLLMSRSLLDDSYPSAERVRPNRFAAEALLARIYLYQGNWELASQHAQHVIAHTHQYALSDVNTLFKKSSTSTIWALVTPTPTMGSDQARFYITSTEPVIRTFPTDVLQAFETDDLRKSLWVGTYTGVQQTYYFPNKYTENSTIVAGGVTEYPVVLRLEEMYLIRAESLAHLNRLEEARNDLNKIRSRANLSLNTSTSKEQLIEDILKERRVEFLMEYGHRFFDLKRLGKLDEILGQSKAHWRSEAAVWPLPEKELLANPNLLPQNTNY